MFYPAFNQLPKYTTPGHYQNDGDLPSFVCFAAREGGGGLDGVVDLALCDI